MHLKRLELSGFKSFAKKTTLDFPKGLTVIAGPNGSGKSNIVDAIRWALAEQSYKSLRGKKGEDLIFYGSGARGGLSRASVAMTFDMAHPEGARFASLDEAAGVFGFSEAVVAREVAKSGENNYFINGRQVRLVDLEEFLARSRVGDSSFRVLSQGMSDKLLTLSPGEFRSFIEEAAGVKEYQDKKHQAELKLKNTRENMERVAGVLAELSPRLKILKREKDKLLRKEEYLGDLKLSSQQLFAGRYRSMLAMERKLGERKNVLKHQLAPVVVGAAKLKEDLFSFDKKDQAAAELTRLADETRWWENEDNRLTKEVIAAEGKIVLERERQERKSPVGADYLKEKIGGLLNRLSIDFKGLDAEALRNILASVALGLQDLLRVIEQGVGLMPDRNILPALEGGLEKLLTEHAEIENKLAEARLAKTRQEKAVLEERHVVLAREKEYRQRETELYALESSLRQLELEEEKMKLHKERLHQDIAGVGVVTLSEILAAGEDKSTKTVLVSVGGATNDSELEEKGWKLKRKIEDIGLIDEAVINEYEGVNERFQFLNKESVDLRTTLTALAGLVKDLDFQVNSRYKGTLANMSSVFGGYFRLIFGGGKASLAEAVTKSQISNLKSQGSEAGDILDVQDDEEEVRGVEIKLDLPNKKIKSLDTLSGGERTLTSIALLLSLASIRKPPVMVLDEIDAALDEANTQKFIRLVRELAKDTQFIIITHNRETMRGADALYGVSMKDGISHLLSLKLQTV